MAIAGRAGSSIVLYEGAYGYGVPLVNYPGESVPNVFVCLNSQDLSDHHTNEHYGVLTVPASVPGAFWLLG